LFYMYNNIMIPYQYFPLLAFYVAFVEEYFNLMV
jgi:hypothetical protein